MMNGWKWWWCGRWSADELLEEADVEDVVQLGTRGQRQPHSHLVDALGDLVWPDEARFQLALGCLGKRGCCPLAKAQQHPVTYSIGDRTVQSVVELLLDSLGLLQAIADIR